jgi:type IV secretory pathway TraG/TraD family ATPase VirD4
MLISVDKKRTNSNWKLRDQKVKRRSVMTNSQAHFMSWRTLRRTKSTSWKTFEISQMVRSNAMTFRMNQI